MDELKLVALDKDDIEVVSAHVQDALVKWPIFSGNRASIGS